MKQSKTKIKKSTYSLAPSWMSKKQKRKHDENKRVREFEANNLPCNAFTVIHS